MIERKMTWWLGWLAVTTVVLQSCTCLQYTPVGLTGVGDSECALLLNGPGRSSSFDYSLNLLRGGGQFGFNGPHTCITYDAVNAAYLEARKRVQVAQPHGDYKPEDVATVGELLLDISVNLARTYGLSYEDIEKGLPLIDTSKTLIREICPPFLSNVECRPGKYRRLDGLCTNLEHPTWGATMQPFTRLIGPLYADGMTAPRISVTGNQLPLARVVSRTMHPDEGFHDHAGTVMVIAWGQFMDHDYTLTGTPLDPLNRNDPEECCKRPPHLKNPYCNEIIIPEDDYFYRLFNVRCMDFVRGFPGARPGCRLGSRSQFNTLTGVIDANTVYGVTEKFSRKLRSGYGGQLRMNPVFSEYGLKDLLPLKLDIPDEGCTRPNRSMYCFEAGEIRVNEQLVLTCMHTLIAREHNRIAEGLAQVNPHWDDETLFQESRRITIAEVQHITYNEFLPILLGKEVMEKFGLLLQKDGYWDGYDPTVNPNVIDAFAAAAYRFGHSLLPTAVERWSKAHKFIASKRLSDLIRRPYDLYRAGVFDEYFMGLMNQVAQAMDDSITQEVTNHLFKKVGARFGMDLVSFNMQRGREFGLPGYMEFRKFCGLPGADTFDELFGSMPNETIKRYTSIFEHPHDVDLWSGGVSERPLPGSMLGPTFACIIATQFSYSRRGDRFWYELPNQPSSFTPEQLKEIRKARLARVICDNTDLIDTIQLYPMVLPDHEINPRVPCRSGVLPSIDFSKWADPAGGAFHQPFLKNKPINNLFETNLINVEEPVVKTPLLPLNIPQYLYTKLPLQQILKNPKLNNIKILPPLVLKPASVVTKQIFTVQRIKRDTPSEDLTNITTLLNITDTTNNEENETALPLVDQVTEAITVTQISGSPPNKKPENRPVNYQPLAITSSDFKNTSNLEEILEDIDVSKLIKEKLNSQHAPFKSFDDLNEEKQDFENYEDDGEELKDENTEESVKENEEIQEQNAKEEDYETDKQEQVEEENEDIQEQDARAGEDYETDKQEQVEEETDDTISENEKLVINVPESISEEDKPLSINEENEEQITNVEEVKETETEEDNLEPIILENFEKHFADIIHDKIDSSNLNSFKNNDDNEKPELANLKINGEKFYLPLEVQDEEERDKDKYFDEIIAQQLKSNDRLEKELEYPDLDNEYEKYRKSAFDEYLEEKQYDFVNADKPYEIKLKGFDPYEKEYTDLNDEVDVGTDKMRVQQNEDYNEEQSETPPNNTKYVSEDESVSETDENQENDKLPTEKKYIFVPRNIKRKREPENLNNKEEKQELNRNTAKYNVKKIEPSPKISKTEIKDALIEHTTENIIDSLNKIMQKKDAISRQQDIDAKEDPTNYNTFWSLEYQVPN